MTLEVILTVVMAGLAGNLAAMIGYTMLKALDPKSADSMFFTIWTVPSVAALWGMWIAGEGWFRHFAGIMMIACIAVFFLNLAIGLLEIYTRNASGNESQDRGGPDRHE